MDLGHESRHERDSGDPVFFEVLTGVARKGPSSGFRFNRVMEDVSSMSSYLHDIRLCFIALTILIYCWVIGHLIQRFLERRRQSQNSPRRHQWDFQTEANPAVLGYRNQSTQLEDLVSVRSDGQIGNSTGNANNVNPNQINQNSYINRNHRSSTPSMRHGGRHQFAHEIENGAKVSLPEKTKLMPSLDTDPTKHQIPHIVTLDLPPYPEQPSSVSSNEEKTIPNRSLHQRPPFRQSSRHDSTDM